MFVSMYELGRCKILAMNIKVRILVVVNGIAMHEDTKARFGNNVLVGIIGSYGVQGT